MEFLAFALYSAFCFWIVFMGGNHVIEGWKSFWLVDYLAAKLNAEQLKLYVGASWIAALITLVITVSLRS